MGDLAMLKFILAAGVALTCMSNAWGGGVVYLDDEASLAQLRAVNPVHYARAQKIIDAANQLCRPTAGEVEYAKFDAKDISCLRSLLRTSNPPKRQISFRLDDTRYIALVTVTDDPPRLVAASPQR
jgi:hypothetical protein